LGFTGLACFTGLVGALRGTADDVRGGGIGSFFSLVAVAASAAAAVVVLAEGNEASMNSFASTISHHLLDLFASLPTALLSTAIQPSLS